MNWQELSLDQRRTFIDASQLYEEWLRLERRAGELRGGMVWKTVAGREYLIRTLDRSGHVRSLGVRSPKTEQRYSEFLRAKDDVKKRRAGLREQLGRAAKFCVAAGVNRVPRLPANIIRLLDRAGLLGTNLIILGSHALYAYEAACGVQIKSKFLQTDDLDALFDTEAELNLAGSYNPAGLLEILRKADKSFTPQAKRSFRAVNDKGFLVDLLRAPLASPRRVSVGASDDLIAEPLPGLNWLVLSPRMEQIVIGEDGFPLRFIVPEPRIFALHKLWLSVQPSRQPIKRKRDFRQGELVAELATTYLGLNFDEAFAATLPAELRSHIPGLKGRLRNHLTLAPPSLPPGFEEEAVAAARGEKSTDSSKTAAAENAQKDVIEPGQDDPAPVKP